MSRARSLPAHEAVHDRAWARREDEILQRLDAAATPSRRIRVRKMREGETRPSWAAADVETYEERGERAVVPETFSSLPRVEGLSESIARALEPVRVFCESSLRDADEGETRAAKSAPAGVPELARAFERRRGEANEGV